MPASIRKVGAPEPLPADPRHAVPARHRTAAAATPFAPADDGPPPRGAPVVVVEGLAKTYPDGTRAVDGIHFQVGRGEIFGLLGPNGAGKTTTMRILGTLHAASAGKASVLGLDVATQGAALRGRIGFAMQEVGLDDLATAREMLVFHARLYGIPKAEAARRAQAQLEAFDLAAHGDRRVTSFSGGMKRRLDLAVSLAHDPELLILDEPSTGLDPKSRGDLWATLRRLRRDRGLTILMSTHYMDEADALCDRLAIMDRGRIAAIDTPAGLKRRLGGEHLRIELATQPTAEQRRMVERTFGPEAARWEGGALLLATPDASRAMAPAVRALGDLGLTVAATRALAPTLDDVFLRYTGMSLQAQGNGPGNGQGKGPENGQGRGQGKGGSA